jgi:Secretion system C-terminal sorting domain
MKKQLHAILLCVGSLFAINTLTQAQSTLIYDWNFNAADSSAHAPSYTVSGGGAATYEYWCSYTDFTTGSAINKQMGDAAGNCIRFRNPSDSVTFFMPTTGYKNIQFSYAEQRTNSGSAHNQVLFSTDGVNFVPTATVDAVDSSLYTIDSTDAVSGDTTEWELHTFNFTASTASNNNAHFAVTIVFVGGPDSSSGNDRFDNVTLSGTANGSTAVASVAAADNYKLYPNPVSDELTIEAAEVGKRIVSLYDMIGNKIYETSGDDKTLQISTSKLVAGNYILSIVDDNGTVKTMRFVKQ